LSISGRFVRHANATLDHEISGIKDRIDDGGLIRGDPQAVIDQILALRDRCQFPLFCRLGGVAGKFPLNSRLET